MFVLFVAKMLKIHLLTIYLVYWQAFYVQSFLEGLIYIKLWRYYNAWGTTPNYVESVKKSVKTLELFKVHNYTKFFLEFIPSMLSFFFSLFYLFIYLFLILKSLILTCIPKHEPPSHLPPHNISVGHPRAPAPSMLYPAS